MPPWRAQPAGPAPGGQAPAADLGWPAALLAIGFAAALCIPYRPYVLALRAASAVSGRTLLIATTALALTALLIYPAYGSDLFVYLDYERLWVTYGANPLLAFPNSQPADWAFRYVWIPEQPSPYGPLWPIVTWPIAILAGDSLWDWIVGYKLLALLGYVMCCGLVWQLAQPSEQWRAFLLFAWSPLVLFEVLGKAHNDSLIAVSALAAVWFVRRSPATAMLAATAGALIKASGLAIVLGVALWLLRARAWRQLLVAIGVSAVVTATLYAPFWVGPQTLAPLVFQTSRVVWSPGALLISGLGWLVPHMDLIARAMRLMVWAAVCVLVWRYGRVPASDYAWLLLGTLLLLTTAFFAHYLVPVIALAAIAGSRRLERVVLALSIGSLAAYSVELLALALPPGWIGSAGYQALGSVLILGPAAAVGALDFRRAAPASGQNFPRDRGPSPPDRLRTYPPPAPR